ncbi:MAG TPA: lamin tail domain-containing protein, partial [Verrucomicrobiales bacterium]|nr:lamin tail domain-containing protein [Verrucomicrobiales bacterium]
MKIAPILLAAFLLPLAARADDIAVVFNEIHYHQAGAESEWIEFYNLHGVNVDMSGWSVDGGVDYTFAEGTVIPGHGFLLVAGQQGGVPGALGPWTGNLNNAGESVRLKNRDGRIMAEVNFSDDGDWPVGPDGSGTTLARRAPGADNSPAAWTSSNEIGGTPGSANFAYPGAPGKPTTAIPITAAGWKYLTPGTNPPAGWTANNFDDSAWSTGQAVFYGGTAQIAAPVPPVTTLSDPGVGLYAWWAFDDNLNNSVAAGTPGTAVGTDFAYVVDPPLAGKSGKSLRINVNASNVDVATTHIAGGNLPLLTLASDFTWAAWVKSRQTGGNNIIFGNRYTATGGDTSPLQFIKLTPSNFEWYANGVAEHNDYVDLVGSAAAPSPWTHFASVKSGNTLSLYRNGVLVTSRTISGAPAAVQPFFIGGNRTGAGTTTEAWSGFIDDMALWTKAVPAQAIAGLAAGTYTPATTPTTAVTTVSIPPRPAEIVFPTTMADVLVDSFTGPAIDTAKWTELDQGLESTGAAGYSAAITSGQLVLSGTATSQYWYGKSLRSVAKFSSRNRQDVSVDRVLLTRGGPATNVVRSSLWLWADANHFIHFSQNWGETGWSYNSNDVGGTGTLNPTGGGNNLALADAADNIGSAAQMRLVWIPGPLVGSGTVEMYKDGQLLGSQSVSNWPADFHVMITGQARAVGDIVSATFDNLKVTEISEVTKQTQLPLAGSPYYFRKTFTFDGDTTGASATLWPLIDDGAIIYLNGTELTRVNAPGGALTPSMTASNPVVDPYFPASAINIPGSALLTGTNVLAVAVLNATNSGDPDMMFGVQLKTISAPVAPRDSVPGLVFDLIRGPGDSATNPANAIIIRNIGSTALNYTGLEIRSGTSVLYTFPAGSLAAGATFAIPYASLPGFSDGLELNLIAGGVQLLDSRRVAATAKGRYTAPDGTLEWAYLTPHNSAIVINEIFYDGPDESPEQWVELHNKSGSPVSLEGWGFRDGITYDFAPGTTLPAGGYLVVAWDVPAFQLLHPGVTNVVGPFDGGIAGGGERLRLLDAGGNLADEVRYYPGEKGTPLGVGGLWPKWANGGGASLELVDPNADNNNPASWSDSAATPGAWLPVSYDFSGASISNDPTQWNEVIFGLLDDGEILIDDFRLIVDPGLAGEANLVSNSTFEADTIGQLPAGWRLIGTHRHSFVEADPDNAGQKVLHVRATGAYEHMHNQCSITLKNGASLVAINPAKTYRISFRAKWLRGSNQLHTRLYFNRGAKTTLLPEFATAGTPGVQNSTYGLNARSITFSNPLHSPAVPAANQPATVSVKIVESTQTITAATLVYAAIDGGAGSGSTALTLSGNKIWTAQIPAQTAGRKFSFSFTATGSGGANITAPGGTLQWDDGQARLTLPTGVSPTNLRIIMSNADQTFMHTDINVMSNDRLPCTIIENERDIYYNCAVRLKGSERGRNQSVRVGFNIMFPPEKLFRGNLGTITIDRSGAGNEFSQKEMLAKHAICHAGGLPSMEDDLIRVLAPQLAQTGPAIMTRRYDGDWLADRYSGTQDDGTMFEYELIYFPTSTTGTVESPKRPEPDDVRGVGVSSLGANKELYRWHWLIKDHRERDDYTQLMAVLSALGQGAGTNFNNAVEPIIDADQWTRSFAAQILFGVGDGYSSGAQHNLIIYAPPAGSGLKAMYFPWDMDFTFNTGATSSMTPNTELNKFLANPKWKRAYWGHVRDICTTTYKTSYMTPWAQHYTKFVNQDLTSFLTYINDRSNYALTQVNAAIPPVTFAITTATGGSPGANFSAPGPLVTLDGDAWVDVQAIRINGGEPVPVTWVDDNSWRISASIFFGPNNLLIEGLTSSGTVVASDTIVITGTTGPTPASSTNTALTELMYNPSAADAEYIELLNVSGNTVDFSGCYFSQGITYNFPAGTQVPAGGRILVVESQSGFAAAHPGYTGQIAGGDYASNGTALSNGGENLTLLAANGSVIFTTSYTDDYYGTDAGGRSLVRMLSSTNPSLTTYNWRPSVLVGGNPGGTDAVAFTGTAAADADKDGYNALTEYAFGTSDTDATSKPAPVVWPFLGVVFSLDITRAAGA